MYFVYSVAEIKWKKTPKHFCVTSTFILAVHINYHLQYLDNSWNKQINKAYQKKEQRSNFYKSQ